MNFKNIFIVVSIVVAMGMTGCGSTDNTTGDNTKNDTNNSTNNGGSNGGGNNGNGKPKGITTLSAPASLATSMSCLASSIVPLWFTPASAITKTLILQDSRLL